MKLKMYINLRKKLGFTIIESLVYIFLTVIVLVEGINIFVLMYKSYIQVSKLAIEYNDLQNFYINLDTIIGEENVRDILLNDEYILFSYYEKDGDCQRIIKSNEGKVFVVYTQNGITQTINIMLQDIQELKLKKKEKLIYLIVKDKDGKEFIRCI